MTSKVSIIIPVLNEYKQLAKLVPYLTDDMQSSDKEIILAISSKDQTDYQNIVSGTKVVLHHCEGAGRSIQMNEGAQQAIGDILFFVHADVRPPLNAIVDIRESIVCGFSGGFFSYQFDSKSPFLKINAAATKRDGWFAGGGDQCQWMTRPIFDKLGGYNSQLSIMEDFDMVKKWRRTGVNYTIIQEDALVSARKYKDNSYLWVNLVNLITVIFHKFGMNDQQLKRMYSRLL